MDNDFNTVYLRTDPENIVLLKSILESYDELGILRTIDQSKGYLAILSLKCLSQDLMALLESLRGEFEFEFIQGEVKDDWFMTEVLSDQG
jgi:hypothetical protein